MTLTRSSQIPNQLPFVKYIVIVWLIYVKIPIVQVLFEERVQVNLKKIVLFFTRLNFEEVTLHFKENKSRNLDSLKYENDFSRKLGMKVLPKKHICISIIYDTICHFALTKN